MACNCTKCSEKCSCSDTALTNPCTYTDCSVGSERCDDVQCAACVSYCGTSFQIGPTGQKIVITSGERLDSIIQKFAMILHLMIYNMIHIMYMQEQSQKILQKYYGMEYGVQVQV